MRTAKKEKCANCGKVGTIDFMADITIDGYYWYNLKREIIRRRLCYECYRKFMDSMKVNGSEK